MQEEKEKNVDIKGTIEKFIKAEEPELEQEEAIMKYEEVKKKKVNLSSSDDEVGENSEEQEHLKRVKQELLASLKRVEELEKRVFQGNILEDKKIKQLKVQNGGKSSITKAIDEINKDTKELNQQKERE